MVVQKKKKVRLEIKFMRDGVTETGRTEMGRDFYVFTQLELRGAEPNEKRRGAFVDLYFG